MFDNNYETKSVISVSMDTVVLKQIRSSSHDVKNTTNMECIWS